MSSPAAVSPSRKVRTARSGVVVVMSSPSRSWFAARGRGAGRAARRPPARWRWDGSGLAGGRRSARTGTAVRQPVPPRRGRAFSAPGCPETPWAASPAARVYLPGPVPAGSGSALANHNQPARKTSRPSTTTVTAPYGRKDTGRAGRVSGVEGAAPTAVVGVAVGGWVVRRGGAEVTGGWRVRSVGTATGGATVVGGSVGGPASGSTSRTTSDPGSARLPPTGSCAATAQTSGCAAASSGRWATRPQTSARQPRRRRSSSPSPAPWSAPPPAR